MSLSLDQDLDRLLTTDHVAHALITYPGYTHEQIAPDATMLDRVRAWYTLQGVL